jgi:glycerol uptake facilitator-like aquaporin
MVAAWIGAAYWFAASTSFANPAITIARSLTNTFSGIRPTDVPAFIAAQFASAVAALGIAQTLFGEHETREVQRSSRQLEREQRERIDEAHGNLW